MRNYYLILALLLIVLQASSQSQPDNESSKLTTYKFSEITALAKRNPEMQKSYLNAISKDKNAYDYISSFRDFQSYNISLAQQFLSDSITIQMSGQPISINSDILKEFIWTKDIIDNSNNLFVQISGLKKMKAQIDSYILEGDYKMKKNFILDLHSDFATIMLSLSNIKSKVEKSNSNRNNEVLSSFTELESNLRFLEIYFKKFDEKKVFFSEQEENEYLKSIKKGLDEYVEKIINSFFSFSKIVSRSFVDYSENFLEVGLINRFDIKKIY